MVNLLKEQLLHSERREVSDNEQNDAIIVRVVHHLDEGGHIVHRVRNDAMNEGKLGVG